MLNNKNKEEKVSHLDSTDIVLKIILKALKTALKFTSLQCLVEKKEWQGRGNFVTSVIFSGYQN